MINNNNGESKYYPDIFVSSLPDRNQLQIDMNQIDQDRIQTINNTRSP